MHPSMAEQVRHMLLSENRLGAQRTCMWMPLCHDFCEGRSQIRAAACQDAWAL